MSFDFDIVVVVYYCVCGERERERGTVGEGMEQCKSKGWVGRDGHLKSNCCFSNPCKIHAAQTKFGVIVVPTDACVRGRSLHALVGDWECVLWISSQMARWRRGDRSKRRRREIKEGEEAMGRGTEPMAGLGPAGGGKGAVRRRRRRARGKR